MANETTTTETTGNAGNSKGSSISELDRFLNEHTEGAKTQTTTQPVGLDRFVEAVKPVVEYAETKRMEEMRAVEQKSIDAAISFVKGDDLKTVPDRLVKGFLQDRYVADQSFRSAYDNRTKDPTSWNSALTGAQKEFKADLSTLGVNASRSDVEAATAAVRNSGRVVSEGQKVDSAALSEMSDTAFNKYKRDLEAQRRAAR